jgi:hypothetical protein
MLHARQRKCGAAIGEMLCFVHFSDMLHSLEESILARIVLGYMRTDCPNSALDHSRRAWLLFVLDTRLYRYQACLHRIQALAEHFLFVRRRSCQNVPKRGAPSSSAFALPRNNISTTQVCCKLAWCAVSCIYWIPATYCYAEATTTESMSPASRESWIQVAQNYCRRPKR